MDNYEELVITARSPQLDRSRRQAAFGALVRRFEGMAYTCACKLLDDTRLAEDVTQEAFITAYQKLHQLREPKAFPHWLRRIIRTQCNRWRRRKRLATTPLEIVDTILPEELGAQTEQHDLAERILAAIETLPEHEQVIVRLFYLQGYSLKEIGEFLSLPLNTIKKRLQYARGRLKQTIIQASQSGQTHFQIHVEAKVFDLIGWLIAWLQPEPVPVPITLPTQPASFKRPHWAADERY